MEKLPSVSQIPQRRVALLLRFYSSISNRCRHGCLTSTNALTKAKNYQHHQPILQLSQEISPNSVQSIMKKQQKQPRNQRTSPLCRGRSLVPRLASSEYNGLVGTDHPSRSTAAMNEYIYLHHKSHSNPRISSSSFAMLMNCDRDRWWWWSVRLRDHIARTQEES